MLVYLNGAYVDHADARISVDDRAFLFADGIYEVIRLYHGRPFLADAHYQRLRSGLAAIGIAQDPVALIPDVAERLSADNGVDGDGIIYIQISRGAAPRRHAFPSPAVPPTVYVTVKPFQPYPPVTYASGVPAITAPDNRWARCDIKSVSLLPNVLANQQAHAADAFEALFVRDGVVIEGSHSNLLAVIDGVVTTYPACNYILPGITRTVVLELAAGLGYSVREGPILLQQLFDVDELFLSGTTTEVMPIVRVDGRDIGSGRPGPIARKLQERYLAYAQETVAQMV